MIKRIFTVSGGWDVTVECGMYCASHRELERGDVGGGESGPAYAGGPVSITAPSFDELLDDILAWEIDRAN